MAKNDAQYRGLGKPVSNLMSSDEILVAAGLDWKTVPMDIDVVGKTQSRRAENFQALVRSDNADILDITTKAYKPMQNKAIVDVFKALADAGEIKLETAGALDAGRRVFLTGKMTGEFTMQGKQVQTAGGSIIGTQGHEAMVGDTTVLKALMGSGHAAGYGFTVDFIADRLVCANGAVFGSLKAALRFMMPHTTKYNPAYEGKLRNVIAKIRDEFALYEARARKLQGAIWDTEVTRQFVVELLQKPLLEKVIEETGNRMHFGHQLQAAIDATTRRLAKFDETLFNRPVRKILELVAAQPGADMAPGSAWNAVNAVTYFVDHVRGRQDSSAQESSWYGEGAKVKASGLDLALQYTDRYNPAMAN